MSYLRNRVDQLEFHASGLAGLLILERISLAHFKQLDLEIASQRFAAHEMARRVSNEQAREDLIAELEYRHDVRRENLRRAKIIVRDAKALIIAELGFDELKNQGVGSTDIISFLEIKP